MKACVMGSNEAVLRRVFTQRQYDAIARVLGEEPETFIGKTAPGGDAEYIFSTWGIPDIDVKKYPNLKAVFYGAGSVQTFARNILSGGVKLFSAWRVNAVSVAEFTFAQIILSLKGAVRESVLCAEDRKGAQSFFQNMPGAYRTKVGLLGLGAIGTLVSRLLKHTDIDVYAYDPFASEEKAAELGVTLADMDEIFKTCHVVSNHIANLPETVGIIKRHHLMNMLPYSTFINTGRGAQLSEEDLKEALLADPTRTALLDVITNEADFDACVLKNLPNCFFTPHVAGASGNEVERMGQKMVDDLVRFLDGEKIEDEVTESMLKSMA